ncbi:hypothetical protein ACJMK2_034201 [Sinanodonta woodiana]|uniref:Uncharacterized protein n=1 Tax=Sinanodonta woodiana TaxID=1069815 RepID=A0ABD3WUZ7_SINWO
MKSIDNLQSQSPTSETRFSAVRDVICSDGPLQNKVKANPPTSIVKSHSQRRDVSKSVSMKEKRSNSMPEKTRRSSSTTYSRTVSFTKFRADLSLDSLSLLNREKFDTPILETRPESYMWLAICTTLFFNPVLGIIALVTSSKYMYMYTKRHS